MIKTSINDGKKVIAAFDFDGTITKRDTLPFFIWFAVTLNRLITGSLLMAPSVLLFKLKFIPNYKAKEKLFKTFFAGTGLDKFNRLSEKFVSHIEKIVNPAALEKIKWHHEMGHEVIIISASAENWITPWANKHGINTILATRLEVNNNLITGNFLTKNCHGPEKVERLMEKFPDRDSYTLYVYGDSNGDKELLALADHSFYRSF
jgi:phosphatidylglycerophosphatase C